MKTKLEQIETIQELITYITAFGIPTDTESICKMQDIVGNSPVKTLVELAQDDGTRTDDEGHKWSTGRHGTQKEMMALLFTIWHWEDATSFYNRHVNPIAKKEKADAEKHRKEVEDLRKALANEREQSRRNLDAASVNADMWEEADERADKAERALKEAQDEILKLKAMLFDYMTKA